MKKVIKVLFVLVLISIVVIGIFQTPVTARVVYQVQNQISSLVVPNVGWNGKSVGYTFGDSPIKPLVGWNS